MRGGRRELCGHHRRSSMLLFGTGLGTAFFKYTADLGRDVRVMADTNRRVVLADWLFTTPTILLQPLTGYLLLDLKQSTLQTCQG